MRAKHFFAALAGLLLATPSAHAGAILFWADLALGTDQMAAALAASSHVVTTAGSEADFVTQLGGGGWDLVVFMNQDTENPSAKASLESWVAGGGKAIYTDWIGTASTAAVFDASYTGGVNESEVTLTNPSLLAGLTNPVSLFNPGWGIFSVGMSPLPGGVTAATFGSGEAAIIIGNGGLTIINGFLDDTFVVDDDGVTLYTNELNLLLGPAVPEPGCVLLLGVGLVGLVAYRRRQP